MVCYVHAAVWCGKFAGREASLWDARVAIGIYTAIALAAIAAVGWIGFRAHSHGESDVPHDADSPEDRHRFIGFATVLLSGLGFVATIYSGLAAVFIETCH